MENQLIENIGLVAAVILPLFNIPLVMRIIQRGSSEDISLFWAIGVWCCFVLMLPSGLTSEDKVWRVFNIMNFVLFSIVMVVACRYHKGKKRG